MSDTRTAHLSVRIPEKAKEALSKATAAAGVDPSIAIRQVVEMMVRRFEAGADFWDVMHEMKSAMDTKQTEIERRLAAAHRALAEFKPAPAQDELLSRIDELERQLLVAQSESGKRYKKL